VIREAPLGDERVAEARPSQDRARSLFELHFDFIWRLLRRQGLAPADADDAAQEVFMTAVRRLGTIAEGSERPFLYGVAVRVAANARRGASRRREVVDGRLDARHGTAAGPDEHAELRKAWALLDELFERLPKELARVLALAEIEQLEVPEIAELEAIPIGTAASRLRRARSQFRDLLAACGDRNPFSRGEG
jgi:RNA polymerase sigma-70 factor (ECF subfamily)